MRQQWLQPDLRADYQARQQWIDNNMSYLDGLALAVLHSQDADFRRGTWSVYHNLHMCRLGVCPNWGFGLWSPGNSQSDCNPHPPPHVQTRATPPPTFAKLFCTRHYIYITLHNKNSR
eukprot:scaffold13680_cov128-Isochrysis_galbana.AAC.6